MPQRPCHLTAWGQAADLGAVLTDISFIADSQLTQTGTTVTRVPRDMPYIGAYYAGTPSDATLRATFAAPSLEPMPFELQPIQATVEPGVPAAWRPMFDSPRRFVPDEALRAQWNTDDATPDFQTTLAWLTAGPIALRPPPTDARWIRFVTAAAAVTARAWTARALTSPVTLPTANYTVYDMRGQSTSAIAGRILFPDGSERRPGTLLNDAVTDDDSAVRRVMSQIGPWGTFNDLNLPQIELYCDAADNEIQEIDLLCTVTPK